MEGLDKVFDKLIEEKTREKEGIIKKAEEGKKDIIKELEEKGKVYFLDWYNREKERLLRKKQEEIFSLRLNAKREILKDKERIWGEIIDEERSFLMSNRNLLPKKELITKKGIMTKEIDIEEYLVFLKEKCKLKIEKLFPL